MFFYYVCIKLIQFDTYMQSENKNQKLLTVKEASELLKVAEISVKRYVSQGLIPSVKIGGARRIIQNEVWEDFVNYSSDNQDDSPEIIKCKPQ